MEQNNPTTQTPNADAQKAAAAKKILGGAFLALILTVVYFGVITYAENQEGTTRVYWLIAAVYNSMGKIGGTALFGGISVLLFIVYFVKSMKK